jgi:hypothetical protein
MSQSFDLGPYITDHHAVLRHVLSLHPEGVALEFGVGEGNSLRVIAEHMPVIGFDSFAGLPEAWRDGYPKGMFATEVIPRIDNAVIKVGMFEDTLPDVRFEFLKIGLLHCDADLYSSTATVLKYVGPHLKPGCYVIFDEWHRFDGCENYEQRAWREFAADTGIQWEVVGHGIQQWSLRIVAEEQP